MMWIALTAAFMAKLLQHIGLAEELAELLVKVAKCPKCTTFWVTLAVLVYSGCDKIAAVTLSLFMAYMSLWVGFALMGLQQLYDLIWEKINKKE